MIGKREWLIPKPAQHNGQGLPEEGPTLPWAGCVPSQLAPAHPLQGTASCENAFKEGKISATKEKGKKEKRVRNDPADSKVRQEEESWGAPNAKAETTAEQRGFSLGIEAQGKPTL